MGTKFFIKVISTNLNDKKKLVSIDSNGENGGEWKQILDYEMKRHKKISFVQEIRNRINEAFFDKKKWY